MVHGTTKKILILLNSKITKFLFYFFPHFHMLHLITMQLELLISFCWIWPVWEFPRSAWIKILSSILMFSRVQSFPDSVTCPKHCRRIHGSAHPCMNQPKLKGQLLQGNQEQNPPVGLLHLEHNTIISQTLVMSGTPDTGWPSKHIHTEH